jgi:hypothetical protein
MSSNPDTRHSDKNFSGVSVFGRPSQPPAALSASARALLRQLDGKVALGNVADQYPRLMNRVAELWDKPKELEAYFAELITDSRGNRQGFPFKVLKEVNLLRVFYVTKVHPRRLDPWDLLQQG